MKVTIQEYCKQENVTPQSVYARIKRGTLEAKKENKITYVMLNHQYDNNSKVTIKQPMTNPKQMTVSMKRLKKLEKHSTQLQLYKEQNIEMKLRIEKLETMLDSKEAYIGKIMNSIIPLLGNREEIIDAEIELATQKEKKSKKKKNKK